MTKAFDYSNHTEVKKRVDILTADMKKIDPEKYKVNEEKITNYIVDSLS